MQNKQIQRKSITTTTSTKDNIQGKLLGTNVKEINIEKFREMKYQVQQYKLNGKLNEQILKTISNKFSQDLIFNLDLSNQQLTNIDALNECKNLVFLNISKNSIKDFFGIQNCTQIQFLNASSNLIVSCEHLKNMKMMNNLILLDNKIKDFQNLKALDKCDNFHALYLQSLSGKEQNPICQEKDYRQTVLQMIPQLKRLDGVPKLINNFDNGENIMPEKQMNKESMNFTSEGKYYTNSYPTVQVDKNLPGEEELKNILNQQKQKISALEAKLKALNI